MQQTTFVTFLFLAAAFTGVSWSMSDLLTAYQSLDPPQRKAIDAFGPNFLTDLFNVSKCLADEFRNFSICNFRTPIDPLYYLNKCANGTLVQKLVVDIVRPIPVFNLSFGVPQRVSNDRCDCDLVPQASCFFTTPSPPTLPPVPAVTPPSVVGPLGDKLGGR